MKRISKQKLKELVDKGAVVTPKPELVVKTEQAVKMPPNAAGAVDIREELAALANALHAMKPPVVTVTPARLKVLHVEVKKRNTQNRLELVDIKVEYV